MDNSASQDKSKSAVVRSEFDKILMHHVSSLIDTREDIAALPFDLATIASLLLLAERENEIKSFPDSPPERYNRETFLSDIEEIGLDLDEDAVSAIQNLERYGFLVVNPQSQYAARETASLLIMLLDAIFPQMPGMNLVAYVSQAIEEVLTGRKEQDQALRQFDQTLEKQGVRLSAIPEDKLASTAANRILAHEPPDPEVLLARRAAYLQKLQALREKRLTSDAAPSVVAGGAQLKHVKIKELFPRKEDAQELEPQPEETLPADAGDEIPPDAFPDETISDSAPDSVSADTPPMDAAPEIAADLTEAPPDMVDDGRTDAAISAEFDESPGMEPETVEVDASGTEAAAEEPLSKEELVERQIRQFEEELAMPCPICGTGKVLSDTTEKGKAYYHCSNEDCRLITWGKPYHMACPVCKNPFLIEAPESDGQIGLKCPRATCMFRRKAAEMPQPGEQTGTGKRKVAVVKKKRKKGVRRVVRRKK